MAYYCFSSIMMKPNEKDKLSLRNQYSPLIFPAICGIIFIAIEYADQVPGEYARVKREAGAKPAQQPLL